MGAQGSVVDPDDFDKLERDVTSIRSQVSGLNALKDKVDDISKAAVSELDYEKLAETLALATNYTETLAKAIAKNPNELSVPLALEISKTSAALEALNQNLSKNTVFQDKVADTLSSNPSYKARIKGEQGAAGNIGEKAAIKSNLYDTGLMMWCADGELCKLPTGKNGLDFGKGESKIWDDGNLKIRTDDSIYIQNKDNFGYYLQGNQNNFQGPSHFRGGDISLYDDKALNLGHGWKIHPNDSGLRFYKDGNQKFVIHNDGHPWSENTGYLMGKDKYYVGAFHSSDNNAHQGFVDFGKNRHDGKRTNGTKVRFEEF